MKDDKFNLKDLSDADLHAWVTVHKPGSDEYNAGIRESMNRVAAIEELMEKSEAPSRHRELIAAGIAIVALAIAIITIVVKF